MDFETLKTSSSNFDKLTKTKQNLNQRQSKKNKYQDDRFKNRDDKTGNGMVIRFLPWHT